MFLKKKKAITPGTRHQVLIDKSLLSSEKPVKNLTSRIIKTGGRNSLGHITIRHRGGGKRKLYRQLLGGNLQFRAVVIGIEYDSNRTAFIARIFDLDRKQFFYILASENLYPGCLIRCGINVAYRIGFRKPLKEIPTGALISNVSQFQHGIGQYARSAGTYCQLIQKLDNYSKVRLPSGEIRLVSSEAYATIGIVSNKKQKSIELGKAGRTRYLGRRPIVRGVAMNPVDHPHGGGQGKTSGGRPSVTPWGKPTKGQPTCRRTSKYRISIS